MTAKVRKDFTPIKTTGPTTSGATTTSHIQSHIKILNWAHHLSSLGNENAMKYLAQSRNQNVRLIKLGNVSICCAKFIRI